MNNVQNCDSYIKMTFSQTHKSHLCTLLAQSIYALHVTLKMNRVLFT
jgi:hypothetical protein